MSDDEQKSLIPFEEYHTVLKACVEDPKVIHALREWHRINDAYYANGGDPLTDSRDESDECYDAYQNTGGAVWRSINEHGFENFIAWANPDRRGMLNHLVTHYIRGGWPEMYPEIDFDIKNKEMLKNLILAILEDARWNSWNEKALGVLI